MQKILSIGFLILLGINFSLKADTATLSVDVDKPGIRISPMLYGLMTEEINHSYDGGLYAELIQNRIFKDPQVRDRPNLPHWTAVNNAKIALDDDTDPVNTIALTTSLRLYIPTLAKGQRAGVSNDGYWGIPALPNTRYTASFYTKANKSFSGPLTVTIETNNDSTVLASATVPAITTTWKQYTVTLETKDLTPSATNHFVISATSPGTIWLNLVSLFPPTYKDRPNGNRIDLMQKLADMHPAFLRLPGGNYLEGDHIPDRFDWRKTIGSLDQRPGHKGPWSYRSSDGLGLLEFFGWCEDLKMEPVLAVYAGYSLQQDHVKPGPNLAPFVADALDEIEYATGDESTSWGKVRAADGHPAPFKIQYVEIGNEDWFDNSKSYDDRYAQFYDAIKAKYPNLQLIATAPVQSRTPDVLDIHHYDSAKVMEGRANEFDKTDRNGPKIFVGEWATTEGKLTPTMNAALGDAAYMTGLERNSDVVRIASYAPLLVNINPKDQKWGTSSSQWSPNLIGYDAVNSFGSPSYYAQKMFSENRGTVILPVDVVQPNTKAADTTPHGGIGVGTWATNAEYKDIKVTTADGTVAYQSDFTKGTDNWKPDNGDWHVQDGILQQTSSDDNCFTITGDAKWTDYTLTLKARKISGNEGFLVLFHAADNENFIWWNVGGWGNTQTQLERIFSGGKGPFGPMHDSHVETGRWYDLRVEVKGKDIQCFQDNKLIIKTTDTDPTPPPLYSTASRDEKTGDVILKVVNAGAEPLDTTINLRGAKEVQSSGKAIVLTSDKPGDQNTIAQPTKVSPKEEPVTDAAATFHRTFPALSVTILRLSATAP